MRGGAAALLCVMGCGTSNLPELAPVTGVVTVGGQPVANAVVTFTPQDGRPSKGTTDESGRFELMYTPEAEGAMLGEHTIRVALLQSAEEDDLPEGAATPQALPKAASDRSIKKEVKAGANDIPIEL
jgi:hypothetical protein